MKVAVIGTGYVGLVTGACFAEMGNHVTCLDVDHDKVAKLTSGIIPIFEPGLQPMVQRNLADGRLAFTSDFSKALSGAHACFIAVGTPVEDSGAAGLEQLRSAATSIGEVIRGNLVIAVKSTVPVGTAEKVRGWVQDALDLRGAVIPFDVVSNPEFLAEGVAVENFMRPDRIIVGTNSEQAIALLQKLYAPFCRSREKLMVMGTRDAELTKYAANAMLATRISFMNEIASICERVGADVEQVRLGIGADPRIGHRYLYPGAGFGGSCFPKDLRALIHAAESVGFEPALIKAVTARNMAQKVVLFEKVAAHFSGNLAGKTAAVWGLAFKPGTDDMREASSLTLIDQLVGAGAKVRAFDPVAGDTARVALAGQGTPMDSVEILNDQYAVLQGADVLVVVTEWKQFRQPDFQRMKSLLREPVLVDGRNLYEREVVQSLGFTYYAIGR